MKLILTVMVIFLLMSQVAWSEDCRNYENLIRWQSGLAVSDSENIQTTAYSWAWS